MLAIAGPGVLSRLASLQVAACSTHLPALTKLSPSMACTLIMPGGVKPALFSATVSMAMFTVQLRYNCAMCSLLRLLLERQPAFFARLLRAAIVIQTLWRGVKVLSAGP